MSDFVMYGNPKAEVCILRVTGEHETELINSELSEIEKEADINDWGLIIIHVKSWEHDLVPWPTHTISENTVKSGAMDTLDYIKEVVNTIETSYPVSGRKYYLAGYSLAGLFALWTSYQTDMFDGIAAVSPSVWYPGWKDYIDNNKCLANKVYLSIGSKEHKTRNRMMSCVLENLNHQYELLCSEPLKTVLEKNEGNHFQNTHIRMAKGIIWLIKNNAKDPLSTI